MSPHPVWLRIRAIARRHAYVLLRSPHRLFDVTLWPLVDVLLFGSLATFVGSAHASGTAKASGYLLAGIVLWHVIYQSQIALSTGFLEEAWTRNLLNLMVTPVREIEYVAGVALFGMVKLVMGVGVMVIGALAFFSFDAWTLGWGLIPIAITLLIVSPFALNFNDSDTGLTAFYIVAGIAVLAVSLITNYQYSDKRDWSPTRAVTA